jgi:hypothetical protein
MQLLRNALYGIDNALKAADRLNTCAGLEPADTERGKTQREHLVDAFKCGIASAHFPLTKALATMAPDHAASMPGVNAHRTLAFLRTAPEQTPQAMWTLTHNVQTYVKELLDLVIYTKFSTYLDCRKDLIDKGYKRRTRFGSMETWRGEDKGVVVYINDPKARSFTDNVPVRVRYA